MSISEIKDIAESLKRRLELLASAGITAIPKAGKARTTGQASCQADWAVFCGSLNEAASFAPCGHEAWKGVLFGIWRLERASVVWGVPVSGPLGGNPFGAPPLAQLEKMLNWLSGEIKADAPVVSNPQVVLAAKCPQAGDYSDTEACGACVPGIEGLFNTGGVLLMGELAAWALLQAADLEAKRGRAHNDNGRSIVVTYSPEELLKDQETKKKAHADLKLLISAIQA